MRLIVTETCDSKAAFHPIRSVCPKATGIPAASGAALARRRQRDFRHHVQQHVMAVRVNGESVFTAGTPAPLFQIYGRAPISTTGDFTYDVRNVDGGVTDGISDVVVQIFPIPSRKSLFFPSLSVDRAENKGTRLLAKIVHSGAT
jgi:hypothetical protein